MNKKKNISYAPRNLSSVHHASFDRLHELTNNYNQAMLLDKLIFWWQISTYTLDDDNTWFTRSVEQIAQESRLSVRTVGRYLKAFTDAGYIEKVNRLHKKKNLYIRVTEKLLFLIGHKKGTTLNGTGEASIDSPASKVHSSEICVFSEHVGRTGSANLAVSLYKDKDCNTSTNNTVREAGSVTFGDNSLDTSIQQEQQGGDKPHQPQATHAPVDTTPTAVEETKLESKYPTYAIEKQIGERLTETTKNYIKGTMHNLVTQHQLQFSNPEQMFSEMVFSLLNVEQQFPGIRDTHHRINLMAKLMREKRWCTPKGFYNHWDVGQTYKAKQEKLVTRERYLKHKEGRGETLYPSPEAKVSKYAQKSAMSEQTRAHQELQFLIATETRYLSTMEAQFKRKPNPMTERVIESTATKLAGLYEQLVSIEGRMQQEAA